MVRASARSVAVYDVSAPAILAASRRAREHCGFVDLELAEIDIVERASDPESTRRLLALICDGQLKEWKVRSWLRTAGGGRSWSFAHGQTVDVGGRRLGLVSYASPIGSAFDTDGPAVDDDPIVVSVVRPTLVPFADNPAWKFPDNPAWNAFMDLVHSGTPKELEELLPGRPYPTAPGPAGR
ncbi:MAG: hypothetical protein QOI44_295 [Actinomycetota bacterium]|nr:hypothetical protein [Actinomycetota bacterium]